MSSSAGGASSLMDLFQPPPGTTTINTTTTSQQQQREGEKQEEDSKTTNWTSNKRTSTGTANSIFQQHVLNDAALSRSSVRYVVSSDQREEEEHDDGNGDLSLRNTILHDNSSDSYRSARILAGEERQEKTERTMNYNGSSSSFRFSSNESRPLLSSSSSQGVPLPQQQQQQQQQQQHKKTSSLQDLFFAPSPASAPTPKTQNSAYSSIPPPPKGPPPPPSGSRNNKPPKLPPLSKQPPKGSSTSKLSKQQQQQQITKPRHQRMPSISEDVNGGGGQQHAAEPFTTTTTRGVGDSYHHYPRESSTTRPSSSSSSSWWTRLRHRYKVLGMIHKFSKRHLWKTSTFLGSFMYVFYHVVFCLAMGSSLTRPNHPTPSMIGLMAKATASGIIFTSAPYLLLIGSDIPAMYPTVDLFLAPFLAKLAVEVDTVLTNDVNVTDDIMDTTFLSTFIALSSIGMFCSSILIILGSTFKLANLGTFLPYPVLCGFFTAVGILLWQLAFKVDANGKSFGMIVESGGDTTLLLSCMIHHIPTIFIAILMKWLGPKNPMMVTCLLFVTILLFHGIMFFITGTSLSQAQDEHWFWGPDDLIFYQTTTTNETNRTMNETAGMTSENWWIPLQPPPAPFGLWNSLSSIHVGALKEGMATVCALSFLYLLRCSLHATALKKNVTNLVKREVILNPNNQSKRTTTTTTSLSPSRKYGSTTTNATNVPRASHQRNFSEAVDLETGLGGGNYMSVSERAIFGNGGHASNRPTTQQQQQYRMIRPKPSQISTNQMLTSYSVSFFTNFLVGNGFGVTPSIAVGQTMYSIGAGGLAPQYGSVIVLIGFYITNFQLVTYIPKTAFSSLIVLAAFDMIYTFFIKSYQKTKEKMEWMACPFIVIFAFMVGLLPAVFLGVACSTFLFVASFFRSGVVKFVATGLTVRSTIERNIDASNWLDTHADRIQILVLQNYLFFGNASSILTYIESMFEEDDEYNNNDEDSLFMLSRSSSSRSSLSGYQNNNNSNRQVPLNENDGSSTQLYSYYIPMPSYLVLDLTLVTGMDTSTVDIFHDIKHLCSKHDCKFFISGLSIRLKEVLALGGFKADPRSHSNHHDNGGSGGGFKGDPPSRKPTTERQVRFFADMDFAVGKAEDHLLQDDYEDHIFFTDNVGLNIMGDDNDNNIGLNYNNNNNETTTSSSSGGITSNRYHKEQQQRRRQYYGFQHALKQIDQQHLGMNTMELLDLFEHTSCVELDPGQRLYTCDGGTGVQDCERGLFFIEHGIMKLERDPSLTLTRGSSSHVNSSSMSLHKLYNGGSLNRMKARTGSFAKQLQRWKEGRQQQMTTNNNAPTTIRLARIGPGWVVGTMEELSGGKTKMPGIQTAVTKCRLHHLPFEKIRQLEQDNPMLILRLYKLLSHLMAKRQEITVGQLTMMHSIMTSSALSVTTNYSSNIKRVPSKSHLHKL